MFLYPVGFVSALWATVGWINFAEKEFANWTVKGANWTYPLSTLVTFSLGFVIVQFVYLLIKRSILLRPLRKGHRLVEEARIATEQAVRHMEEQGQEVPEEMRSFLDSTTVSKGDLLTGEARARAALAAQYIRESGGEIPDEMRAFLEEKED